MHSTRTWEMSIATILMCLHDIGIPEDLETHLIKFIGPALKILNLLKEKNEKSEDAEGPRPSKRQRTGTLIN